MKILLTGADGFIGRHLALALSANGIAIRPASRRHGCDFATMTKAADWRPWLEGIDLAINCVGIFRERRGQSFQALHTDAPSALFAACAEQGLTRAIQISALCAREDGISEFLRSKARADRALAELLPGGCVLRPGLVHGRGGHSAEYFLRLARLPRLPVIGAGDQMLQPLLIGDVVATVLRAIEQRPPAGALDLVGPQCFSFEAWLRLLRQAQGLAPTRSVHIPWAVARAAAACGGPIGAGLLSADSLRMLRQGSACGAVEAFSAFLGRAPLAPTAAALVSPYRYERSSS